MTDTQSKLQGFRARRDQQFKTSEQSPLTPDQKDRFSGLSYFPEDQNLTFALELDTSGEGVGEEITIGTMNGSTKQYVRAGRVHFDVNGEETTLTVFKSVDRGNFFIPFRDSTSGNETYSVGRYLDPKVLPDGKLQVDFNLAYNPYCAYNEGWACAIPPFENRIKVPIVAGESLPDFVEQH